MNYKYGIVATVVDSDKVTGIEKYVLEFLRNTPASVRPATIVYAHPGGRDLILSACQGMRVVFSPFKNRILTDQFWVPLAVRRYSLEFVYNTTLSYPLVGFGAAPHAIIVHDATPWRFPETLSKGMKLYYRPQLNRALRSTALRFVVTVSESSKRDIFKWLGVESSSIHVFPLAVDQDLFYKRTSHEHVQFALHSVRPYILAVGTLEPRKNLQTLIYAFSLLPEEFRVYRLVIVGRKGWQDSLIIPETCRNHVLFTGFVSNEALVELYSFAKIFVMPSIYEGFGIPVLEAMSCGVPVLASNTSSLPEVGGDACLYADPLSAEDMSQGMARMLTDEALRKRCVERGMQRTAAFNWPRSVQNTWDKILQEVV